MFRGSAREMASLTSRRDIHIPEIGIAPGRVSTNDGKKRNSLLERGSVHAGQNSARLSRARSKTRAKDYRCPAVSSP